MEDRLGSAEGACSPEEHTQPPRPGSFCPPLLQNFPSKSHPASAASHGCSKHLCSTLSGFTTDTHTCPQAGLSQGRQSQAQKPGAGEPAWGAHFLSPSTTDSGHLPVCRVLAGSPLCCGSFPPNQTLPSSNPCAFALAKKRGEASGLRAASLESDSSATPSAELCDLS